MVTPRTTHPSTASTATASSSTTTSASVSSTAPNPSTPSTPHNHHHMVTSSAPTLSTLSQTSPRLPTTSTIGSAMSALSPPILGTLSPSLVSPRNSITATNAAARHNRSLSVSSSNYTTNSMPSPNRASFSEFSNEQIIDLMEREQDAIVLKLMREIEFLKLENKILKMNNPGIQLPNHNATPSIRRSSSLSTSGSRSSSTSSTSKRSVNPMFGNYSFTSGTAQQNSNSNNMLQIQEDIIKKYKGEVHPIQRRASLNGRYEEILDENRNLKRQLKKLQSEIEQLKIEKQQKLLDDDDVEEDIN